MFIKENHFKKFIHLSMYMLSLYIIFIFSTSQLFSITLCPIECNTNRLENQCSPLPHNISIIHTITGLHVTCIHQHLGLCWPHLASCRLSSCELLVPRGYSRLFLNMSNLIKLLSSLRVVPTNDNFFSPHNISWIW